MLSASSIVAQLDDFSVGSSEGQAGDVSVSTKTDGGNSDLRDIICRDGHPLDLETCTNSLEWAEVSIPSPYTPRG